MRIRRFFFLLSIAGIVIALGGLSVLSAATDGDDACAPAPGEQTGPIGPFEQIQALMAKDGFSPEESGLVVLDISDLPPIEQSPQLPEFKTLYLHNPDKPLKTASVMKLYTTAAAMHYLSPEYRFKTALFSAEAPQKGTVQGDLFLKAGCDPFFVPEEMEKMARELRLSGIDIINGHLVMDIGCQADVPRPLGWEPEDFIYSYASPLSGLSYAFNSIRVVVDATDETAESPRVAFDPPVHHVRIDNQARIITRGYQRLEFKVDWKDGRELVTVSGKIRKGNSETAYLSISDPTSYFAHAFIDHLRQAGIQIPRRFRVGNAPADAVPILTHDSRSLGEMVRSINVYSNNHMAEMLLRQLGAEMESPPGTMEKGRRFVRHFLEEMKLDPSPLHQIDGSGLTENNRTSARLTAYLLARMAQRFDIGPEFMASLSIVGAQGTLRKHLCEPPNYRRVRGKTGYIGGVMSLAGYVRTRSGRTLAFALFLNGVTRPYRDAWDNTIDEMLRVLTAL